MKPEKSKKTAAKQSSDDPVCERFAWTLAVVFSGSQQQMAKALGCTQSIISRIVRGRQKAGPKLITALAEHNAMNREWVLRGEGPPLAAEVTEYQGDAALPIARQPFVGLPYDNPLCLEDVLYPVPRTLHRRSRYWVRMSPDHVFVKDRKLKIGPADMVLLDVEPSGWPDNLNGRPCLVQVEFEEDKRLYSCRFTAQSIENCNTHDFDFYNQLPEGIEDVAASKNEEGRYYRRIEPLGVKRKKRHVKKCPARMIAVAIFRCGST